MPPKKRPAIEEVSDEETPSLMGGSSSEDEGVPSLESGDSGDDWDEPSKPGGAPTRAAVADELPELADDSGVSDATSPPPSDDGTSGAPAPPAAAAFGASPGHRIRCPDSERGSVRGQPLPASRSAALTYLRLSPSCARPVSLPLLQTAG